MGEMEKSGRAPDPGIEALRALALPDRLLALYGYGIEGCAQRNADAVTAAMQELIGLLDFDRGETAHAFFRLYALCFARCREGRFDQVGFILRALHDAWARALEEVSLGDVRAPADSGTTAPADQPRRS